MSQSNVSLTVTNSEENNDNVIDEESDSSKSSAIIEMKDLDSS